MTLDAAMAELGSLVHDPNLLLGMGTVFVVLVASGLIAALILEVRR